MSSAELLNDLEALHHTIGSPTTSPTRTHHDPVEAFISIISRDDGALKEIPLSAIEPLASYALQNRLDTVLKNVVDLTLQRLHETLSCISNHSKEMISLASRQGELLSNLLGLLSTCSRNPVADKLILPVIDAYLATPSADGRPRSIESLAALPLGVLLKLMKLICDQEDFYSYTELLASLFEAIQSKRASLSDPSSQVAQSGTWTLYRAVRRLAEDGNHSLAYEMFSKLVGADDLPAEAQDATNYIIESTDFISSTENLNVVILFAIGKACQCFQWYDRMLGTAQALVSISSRIPDKSTVAIVSTSLHSMIRALVASDRRKDLHYAGRMVELCTSQLFLFPIPSSVMAQLYDKLEDNGLREEAGRLFLHLDSINARYRRQLEQTESGRGMLSAYTYLPPSGKPQLGLMRYFFHTVGDHGALQKLVDACMGSGGVAAIGFPFIADCVAIMAEAGMEDRVKAIWEQVRNVRGREMLFGNGKAALKAAKLFHSMAERGSRRQRPPSCENTVSPMVIEMGVKSEPAEMTVEASAIQEYRAFARSIAADFTRLKEPLETASHMDLTTVARINFLVGNLHHAFSAARHILNRREIPDTVDVNVMLKALVELDPRAAAIMVERALNRRVRVDRISWGTLLHGAMRARDVELVLIILRRIGEMGISLDSSAVDTLIRGFCKHSGISRQDTQQFLRLSLHLLKTLNHSQRVKMTTLGVLCVQQALTNDLPLLAFEFWDLLVRYKLSGSKTSALQSSIAKAISTVYAQDKASAGFESNQGLQMCDTLGAPEQWTHA